MAKPDRSSPAYAAALADSLKWDAERDEPYLQLPSFPDLRFIPYRAGVADDLVSPKSWRLSSWRVNGRWPRMISGTVMIRGVY